jgi:tetratricopeptide (TPR) repeat protein
MPNRLSLRICLGLLLAVLAAYFPVMNCDFVNWDDGQYIYSNSHVKSGLTRENIVWAWTSFEAANWHPLTWMSHQLDCQLFDLRPYPHHAVNLGWHIASTVVLFLVLRRMTGEDWRPALVAALFGLHPLHVESVAWVSERKDVTSTFFAFVTLGAYTLYAARPSLGRYLGVLAPFAIGLLCKPMLVTWPFVLLLMDYWPLRRTPLLPAETAKEAPRFVPANWRRLVLEKLPLLALAAASSLVTMRAQTAAMKASEHLSLGFRLGNAVVSYATYLRKMVWPVDLAAFYRHIGTRLPLTPVIVSGAVLVLLSLGVLLAYRRRPALLVGWLWYLGTLVPVIGLVQVGLQSMADRYTYIPLVGIFLALAWSIPSLPAARPALGRTVCLAAAAVVVICGLLTYRQTQFWHNSRELWAWGVKAAENPVSYSLYATALHGRSIELYDEADRLYQMGRRAEAERRVAQAKVRLDEAEQQCRLGLQMEPTFALNRVQLGQYQVFGGDLEGALATLSEGVALDPQSAGLRENLGRVLAYMGRIEEACRQFREACLLDMQSAASHYDLGTALALSGDREGAQHEWMLGRDLDPEFSEHTRTYAEHLLGRTEAFRRCPAAAVFHAQEACWSSQTPQAELYKTLAQALAGAGHPVAAYLAAQQGLALAESSGRPALVSSFEQLTQFYEAPARRQQARTAVLAFAAPTFPSLSSGMTTIAVVQAEWAERRLCGDVPAGGRRANDR